MIIPLNCTHIENYQIILQIIELQLYDRSRETTAAFTPLQSHFEKQFISYLFRYVAWLQPNTDVDIHDDMDWKLVLLFYNWPALFQKDPNAFNWLPQWLPLNISVIFCSGEVDDNLCKQLWKSFRIIESEKTQMNSAEIIPPPYSLHTEVNLSLSQKDEYDHRNDIIIPTQNCESDAKPKEKKLSDECTDITKNELKKEQNDPIQDDPIELKSNNIVSLGPNDTVTPLHSEIVINDLGMCDCLSCAEITSKIDMKNCEVIMNTLENFVYSQILKLFGNYNDDDLLHTQRYKEYALNLTRNVLCLLALSSQGITQTELLEILTLNHFIWYQTFGILIQTHFFDCDVVRMKSNALNDFYKSLHTPLTPLTPLTPHTSSQITQATHIDTILLMDPMGLIKLSHHQLRKTIFQRSGTERIHFLRQRLITFTNRILSDRSFSIKRRTKANAELCVSYGCHLQSVNCPEMKENEMNYRQSLITILSNLNSAKNMLSNPSCRPIFCRLWKFISKSNCDLIQNETVIECNPFEIYLIAFHRYRNQIYSEIMEQNEMKILKKLCWVVDCVTVIGEWMASQFNQTSHSLKLLCGAVELMWRWEDHWRGREQAMDSILMYHTSKLVLVRCIAEIGAKLLCWPLSVAGWLLCCSSCTVLVNMKMQEEGKDYEKKTLFLNLANSQRKCGEALIQLSRSQSLHLEYSFEEIVLCVIKESNLSHYSENALMLANEMLSCALQNYKLAFGDEHHPLVLVCCDDLYQLNVELKNEESEQWQSYRNNLASNMYEITWSCELAFLIQISYLSFGVKKDLLSVVYEDDERNGIGSGEQ
jgi:hypothetical protein